MLTYGPWRIHMLLSQTQQRIYREDFRWCWIPNQRSCNMSCEATSMIYLVLMWFQLNTSPVTMSAWLPSWEFSWVGQCHPDEIKRLLISIHRLLQCGVQGHSPLWCQCGWYLDLDCHKCPWEGPPWFPGAGSYLCGYAGWLELIQVVIGLFGMFLRWNELLRYICCLLLARLICIACTLIVINILSGISY